MNNSSLLLPMVRMPRISTARLMNMNPSTTGELNVIFSFFIYPPKTRPRIQLPCIPCHAFRARISSRKSHLPAWIHCLRTQAKELYVYRGKYLDGADFTDFEQLKEGDEVIIYGQLQKYIDTKNGNAVVCEVKNSKIVKLNGQSGSGEGGGGSGDSQTGDNGGFEKWTNDAPDNWTTTSTAGNATLSQSSDAHSGSYSVKVGGTSSSNKRLGYKELQLKAGSYTLKFYAKAATSTGASVRPGYVPVTNGAVGSYTYGDYVNDITNSSWVEVTHTFDLTSDGVYSIVIMNSKNPGGDVLIDDLTLKMGDITIIK